MKKLALALPLILITMNLWAQDKVACKADLFENKPGAVIQKEYVKITTMDHLGIVTEYITNLTSNERLSALDLEYTTSGDNPESVSTMLDPDEVDGLLAFFQNIQDNISKAAAPKNYTEYTYLTKSGFEAGCYFDKVWKTYIRVDKDDSKTNMELNKDDLMSFISFVKQAKSKF